MRPKIANGCIGTNRASFSRPKPSKRRRAGLIFGNSAATGRADRTGYLSRERKVLGAWIRRAELVPQLTINWRTIMNSGWNDRFVQVAKREARWSFRKLPREQREELTNDVVSVAWEFVNAWPDKACPTSAAR